MPKRKISSVEEPAATVKDVWKFIASISIFTCVLQENGEESTDYNDVRSANIRRNEEFLRAIGIDDVVAPISTHIEYL